MGLHTVKILPPLCRRYLKVIDTFNSRSKNESLRLKSNYLFPPFGTHQNCVVSTWREFFKVRGLSELPYHSGTNLIPLSYFNGGVNFPIKQQFS